MKGNAQMIDTLNNLLAEELTAISEYMVHAEMCEQWGYAKLHKAIEKQAYDEMHHAEWLIKRIIFLEGSPTVAKLNTMHIGRSVQEIVTNGYEAEVRAITGYNASLRQAAEASDNGTRDLLAKILADEESHVDWAEKQRDQIVQMGLQSYLANQV